MKSPVVRSFSLPNGSKITSLRESTLRAGLKAASLALNANRPALGYDKIQAARIEGALFDFLSRAYTQTANRRQRRWGDVYMKAETHDLAHAVAKFIMLNRERLLGGP